MIKMKLAWMYLSMFVGVALMIAVNIEMILRQLIVLGDKNTKLRPIPNLEIEKVE
jgi:hypothetical protein